MKKATWKNPAELFLAAVIWGVAFVAQSVGMEFVGPFTFISVRNFIGALVLLPVIAVLDGQKKKKGQYTKEQSWSNPVLWLGGLCCGCVLCIASSFQQIGIAYTSVGKAGFITAMYIVLVPVVGIFLKKSAGVLVWISVLLAVAGLYLLCMTERLVPGKGDALVLCCAVAFSFHILSVDHFSPLADGVKMSCIQFLTAGVMAFIPMILSERPEPTAIMQAWLPILYAGAMSSGVAYTLQIVGQAGMNPTVAALIMSLESVVSVLAGWVLLGQKLSRRELLGCMIMFAAIILAQLPDQKRNHDTEASDGEAGEEYE